MKPESAQKAFRERALVGDARTFRDRYQFRSASDQSVPVNGILISEPGKWIVDKPGTTKAKLRLREDGQRPASWVLLLELTRTREELTLEELTHRSLALLEDKTLPSDEALLEDHPSLMSGSIRIDGDTIRPLPVSRVELLPKALEAMSEYYRERDSRMAWKRRISAAIVALGGPGATDEELARASAAEYTRYEALLNDVPGVDLGSYDGESPASGHGPGRRPAAWSPEWLKWVNPICRALRQRYDLTLPLKASSAEFQRHEALLRAADVDLTPYQMTEDELHASTPHVESVTVMQDGKSATQTFDPPTSLAASADVARGLKSKLQD